MKKALYFLLIIFVTTISQMNCVSTKTARITDNSGVEVNGSIAVLEKLKIGGVFQWILIRGNNVNSPIILKIHGGPGQAEMATANYNDELEKHFVVVEWDQRGAGKSYKAIEPNSGMTLNQLVEDTKEISQYLLKKFNRDKLILMGRSWGGAVGLLTVDKYPKLYSAYVGIVPIINMNESVKLSYKFLLTQAKEIKNDNAIEELLAIGEPPFSGKEQNKKRQIFNKWMEKLGADWHQPKPLPRVKLMLNAVEYSFCEKLHFLSAASKSFKLLNNDMMNINLQEQVKQIKIPLYFTLGKYDNRTPVALTTEYFERLEASQKKLKVFDNSAHFPELEEKEAFSAYIIAELSNENYKNP